MKMLGLEAELPLDILATLIPNGRSRQAPGTNFAHPRTVASFADSGSAQPLNPSRLELANRVFFGYSPAAEELEVLLWNAQSGQFDFAIVADYAAGKTPRTVQIPQVNGQLMCLKCHQARGPIFSTLDWTETLAGSEVFDEIVDRKPTLDSTSRWALAMNHDVNFAESHMSAGLNVAVVQANELLAAADVVRRACGTDVPCREWLAATAYLKPFETDAKASAYIQKLWHEGHVSSTLLAHWPSDGYKRPKAFIPDILDINANNPAQGYPETPREAADPFMDLVTPSNRSTVLASYFQKKASIGMGLLSTDEARIRNLTVDGVLALLQSTAFRTSLAVTWPPQPQAWIGP